LHPQTILLASLIVLQVYI